MIDPNNPYTKMQKMDYEREASGMNKENHKIHNDNPDYWSILVSDTETGFEDKVGLDFGCGCGRNVQNLWKRFKRMDGCDISSGNINFSTQNNRAIGNTKSKFYVTDGTNLQPVPRNEYDFVMSTIVLQHIPIYDIRYGILKDILRVMKPGGLLSFQMGFGKADISDGAGIANYHDNAYQARSTNSSYDVQVLDATDILEDLYKIGFTNITYQFGKPWTDRHPQWIFMKARKP